MLNFESFETEVHFVRKFRNTRILNTVVATILKSPQIAHANIATVDGGFDIVFETLTKDNWNSEPIATEVRVMKIRKDSEGNDRVSVVNPEIETKIDDWLAVDSENLEYTLPSAVEAVGWNF